MSRQIRSSASWRAKRLNAGSYTDLKKKAHADNERFNRAVRAISRKANDIYVDGCDIRSERHVYVLVRSRKGDNFTYMSYNSNPDEDWVPPVQETVRRSILHYLLLQLISRERRTVTNGEDKRPSSKFLGHL
jgi:hypothetical protein